MALVQMCEFLFIYLSTLTLPLTFAVKLPISPDLTNYTFKEVVKIGAMLYFLLFQGSYTYQQFIEKYGQ